MDFKDYIKEIGNRFVKLKEQISTEEATKNAFIMPFLQTLGYDVFNPLEVVPEYVCDIGIKKGEKIDYAIMKDGVPIILIECKHWAQNLSIHDGQLLRYFHVSKAKFALLTNGSIYRFYSDLVASNKMDEKPFLEFNITDIKDNQIDELKKFHKSNFDIESIVNTASELKYVNEIKQLFQQELSNPSESFVKHFAKQVCSTSITARLLEQFTNFTRKALQQYVSDTITERLKTALNKEDESLKVNENNSIVDPLNIEQETGILTTETELEAYLIVKTILRQTIDIKRLSYKDTKSYFNIVLDDSIRKIVCRFYFNSKKKYFAFFDQNKKEIKTEIADLDGIFEFADITKQIALSYDKANTDATVIE